jgi:hypothetical protein
MKVHEVTPTLLDEEESKSTATHDPPPVVREISLKVVEVRVKGLPEET